tara:strand:+ start:142 stop:639 length:498 start_codon:yes stop_codon:yes gene_type:complete
MISKKMKNKIKNISVISTGSWVPSNLEDKELNKPTYKILIENLVLKASIGIHDFEKKKKQKISISMSIDVNNNIPHVDHKINNFVSYEYIVKDIKKLINSGHIELLETLSENIFEICFQDQRIQNIKIKLKKLEVFNEVDSVGIEVCRTKNEFKNLKKPKNLSPK